MKARSIGSFPVLLWLVATGGMAAMAQTWTEAVAAYEREDYATAYRGFRRYAEQGEPVAQSMLGGMYRKGQGAPHDDVEAVKWYRRAAEQGYTIAQFELGSMYRKGIGVPQDYAKAVKWYRRTAEQGYDLGQAMLGTMYEEGQGVPQDHAEAIKWYRRAAEQGYAAAQLLLGSMYRYGRGTPQDYVQAAEWFRRAAEQGHATAQYVLGIAHEAGWGVPQDYVYAHRWYNLAASLFSDPASRESGIQARERVALRLSPTQLAYAQYLAREWQPTAERGAFPSGVNPAETPTDVPTPLVKQLTGSGFRVTTDGHLLTNLHVVRGCAEVQAPPGTATSIVAYDDVADLALLQSTPAADGPVAAFRQGHGIRSGADVVVVGYPLHGIIASEPSISAGIVSALAGPGDDRRLIQITAPIQPGSSGGPVLDSSGHVVGVVVATLDALRFAHETGDIPQNVNFAIAAGAARAFLDGESVPYRTAPSTTTLATDQVAAVGKKFTVSVECWNPNT